MCGRYGEIDWTELHAWLNLFWRDVVPTREHPLNMDVRPTTKQAVLIKTENGLEAQTMRWGLIPFWHRGDLKAFKATTFNARGETVASAPMFRDAFKRRRCLVPVAHFYEWTGEKGSKQQHKIAPNNNEPGLVFAGLYDRCNTADQGEIHSFTIVTHEAGPTMQPYHNRAPLTLLGDDRERWLDPSNDVSDLLGAQSGDHYAFSKYMPVAA